MINYKNIKDYNDCVFEVLARYYFDRTNDGNVAISNKRFERLNQLEIDGRISGEECEAITADIASMLDQAIKIVSQCPEVEIKIKKECFDDILEKIAN